MLIAQLSDPHVRPAGELYHGLVDSNAMFEAAIATLNRLDPEPDVVLLSGDLVDLGAADEYAHALTLLASIRQPLLALPGNHDDREAFRACFIDRGYLPATGPLNFVADDFGPVRIIGLDVTVPGAHHGEFGDEAFDWLSGALAAAPARPTLIMMHQPPVESGISFMDVYRCFGGARLAALLSAYSSVEMVTCGHIHRHMLTRFGGTVLTTAPSTASSIALRLRPEAEPASFVEPPGLLLHHWNGTLSTHLVPIGNFPGPLPFF